MKSKNHDQPITLSHKFVTDELMRYYHDKNHSLQHRIDTLALWRTLSEAGGVYTGAYKDAVRKIDAEERA
jgi:hypothetical protein